MVSICIITRNEAKNLEKCLKRAAATGFEIVVADTGSVDNTKEIAAAYTDKVYDFTWCDDFSAARNFSIAQATKEYILVLDSDEYLEKVDRKELEKLLLAHPKDVGRICRENLLDSRNPYERGRERISRIFSKKLYCYTGRIHEQVTARSTQGHEAVRTYDAPVLISHSGYDKAEGGNRKKAERNIRLLMMDLEERGPDPYVYYQLGKSHYMMEQYGEAADFFGKGLEFDLEPRLEYVSDMVETYGYALLKEKRFEEALSLSGVYEAFSYSADFQFLMGLVYMNNGMFEQAVQEFHKAAGNDNGKMAGVNSYLAWYNMGVIYECLGDKNKALCCYGRCEGYEKAKGRIKELLQDGGK